MTVTIEIPPEREGPLKNYAESRKMTLEQLFLDMAERLIVPQGSVAHLQRTNPEEWKRRFHEWVDSHDPKTAALSDEAMSRESIYPD